VRGQFHAPAAILSGKSPFNGKLCGIHSQSGRFGYETNCLHPDSKSYLYVLPLL